MNTTPLYRVLENNAIEEDDKDRYRTCCMYCRDLIIFQHEKPSKLSGAKICRDIKKAPPFPCKECPYHPDVKNGPHKKDDCIPVATCQRNVEFMVKPNHADVVHAIIRRIPEQQDCLAWEGPRSWANKFGHTITREKPLKYGEVFFSDHKEFDVFIRTKKKKDGTWQIQRPWITAIMDAATDVMVSYVLSLNPNSDCIAECFARACAFTVDTPYAQLPTYFYIDNGADYCSKRLRGLPNSEEEHLYLNKEFCESGMLEWLGVKVIHARYYTGRSKTLERTWETIDTEWIRDMPGYCGSEPNERPYILDEQIKKNELYTFEQFADVFAEKVYPGYNNFHVTKESPNDMFNRLEKVDTIVPSWRTLSVLKSVTTTRVLRQEGIRYLHHDYWCSELGPLVEKEKNTKFRIFAFDTPFNRSISVVKDHTYIGEAFLVEKLNVVERKRYKVISHVKEQDAQYKHYSKKIKKLHSLIMQTDITDEISDIPAVDHIRYGQEIDFEKDKKEAIDMKLIPNALKEQAEKYAANFLNEDNPLEEGHLSKSLRELGKLARQNKKGSENK